MRRLRVLPAVLALGLAAAACSSGGADGGGAADGGGPRTPERLLQVFPASVDLYVGAPQRVAVGLILGDGRSVSYGEVRLRFAFTGTAAEPAQPRPGPEVPARFVPTYGSPAGGDAPAATSPSQARGVYEARGVTFDRAGFWTVEVAADVRGAGTLTGAATFAVLEEPQLPAPGDPALPTENLTLGSEHGAEAAIDSRAATQGGIPDPELHRWTIAGALERGRPALVVFATPVYCVSRFCGPVTDMVQDLASRYRDRAVFIHVEIWEDFQQQRLNDAAVQWLQMPNGDLTEPWLFLIGADGTILDRWSTLWDEDEVAAALEALPPMQAS